MLTKKDQNFFPNPSDLPIIFAKRFTTALLNQQNEKIQVIVYIVAIPILIAGKLQPSLYKKIQEVSPYIHEELQRLDKNLIAHVGNLALKILIIQVPDNYKPYVKILSHATSQTLNLYYLKNTKDVLVEKLEKEISNHPTFTSEEHHQNHLNIYSDLIDKHLKSTNYSEDTKKVLEILKEKIGQEKPQLKSNSERLFSLDKSKTGEITASFNKEIESIEKLTRSPLTKKLYVLYLFIQETFKNSPWENELCLLADITHEFLNVKCNSPLSAYLMRSLPDRIIKCFRGCLKI